MWYDEASADGRSDPGADRYPGRRQLDTLSEHDLRATGAWWFPGPDGHLSGPDDQTVLPLETDAALGDGSVEFPPGRFLLRATFTLADGSELVGHLTFVPGDAGGLREREPTLCTPGGQVPLWHGVLVPAPDEIAAWLGRLGRPREAVFPVRWRADFHPPGDALDGSLDGFAVHRDGRLATV